MFTFIDLFAGIGGLRLAFERVGGKCIFSSEINKYCQKTYLKNFGEMTKGDITKTSMRNIPKHDILTAGFPCQPFSLAGLRKGFEDERGSLFYNVIKIIKSKKPKIVFLENVKNLEHHNSGKTLRTIYKALEKQGYHVHHKIINASTLVPQHRERLYLVATKYKTDFEFPKIENKNSKIKDILEKRVDTKYTLRNGTWRALKRHRKKHEQKGNGFGFKIAKVNDISKTLSARYYKDGSEILLAQKNKNPRRLTPRECARLMGFPESFKIPVSDMQAYRQFGNSVVVPIVTKIAKQIINQCMIVQKT